MAHQLYNYNGLCKNIHGHSYLLYVTVGGHVMRANSDPNDGMVMDFSELKKIVNENIINEFDHALVLNSQASEDSLQKLKKITEKTIVVPFQPTSENLTEYFAKMIIINLPPSIKLLSVRLHETNTSYCEWLQEDNISDLTN